MCRAEMNVGLGWGLALGDSYKCCLHLSMLPATGGGSLEGRCFGAQVSHNNFAHVKVKSPGFFLNVIGLEASFLCLCVGSHHFVMYRDDVKIYVQKTLTI